MKRKILGCSFPVLIVVGIIFVALVVLSLLVGPIGSAILHIDFPGWLKVGKPALELPPGILFNIGSFPFTNTMLTVWISIILVVLVSYLAFRKPRLVPRGLQSVMEFIYGSLLNFCQSIAGEKNGRRFFPVVATIFIFVLANSWLSLLPFFNGAIYLSGEQNIPLFRGANSDINVPLAIALFSFFSVWYFGIKIRGFFHYSGEFIRVSRIKMSFSKLFEGNFTGAFGDLMFGIIELFAGVIEIFSQFIRIISFTFRLFGNMIAAEILLLVIIYLVGFGVPVVFYVLELLTGFIQALIFGGLTLIFLTLAVGTRGEESAG